MTHPFEINLETILPASPEQVWAAIATGPGIDSWFMGRNEVEPREGGIAAMETGGRREEAVITAYEPGKRIATRTAAAADGRFMAFEYLTHFPGRTGVPVFAMAPSDGRPSLQVRAALARELSLPTPIAVGARAHAEPADLPPLDGEVVWSDDERIEVRTADGIYTFHGFTGVVVMFHHLFGPDTDGAEAAWQQWLTGLLS